jgi:hypothetical protein
VENAASTQGQNGQGITAAALEKCRPLLDGMENRDLIYSIMLLNSRPTGNAELSSERNLARAYLESQASGRATNQVYAAISGMALRAFEA